MKTYTIKHHGYKWSVRAKNIDNVRKDMMTKGHRNRNFLAWIEDENGLLGQMRYDWANQRFIWYRNRETINVLNKDGSTGRRI